MGGGGAAKQRVEKVALARASSPPDSCKGGMEDTECTVTGTQTQQQFGPGFVNANDINELSPLDYGNTMPSHPNISAGPNDWENTRNFLLANGASDISGVSDYIFGPDGVLREIDYSDGHPAEFVEQAQLSNEVENDAGGNCV